MKNRIIRGRIITILSVAISSFLILTGLGGESSFSAPEEVMVQPVSATLAEEIESVMEELTSLEASLAEGIASISAEGGETDVAKARADYVFSRAVDYARVYVLQELLVSLRLQKMATTELAGAEERRLLVKQIRAVRETQSGSSQIADLIVELQVLNADVEAVTTISNE